MRKYGVSPALRRRPSVRSFTHDSTAKLVRQDLRPDLVKIMGSEIHGGYVEWRNATCLYVNAAVLILQRPFHE